MNLLDLQPVLEKFCPFFFVRFLFEEDDIFETWIYPKNIFYNYNSQNFILRIFLAANEAYSFDKK